VPRWSRPRRGRPVRERGRHDRVDTGSVVS
jgi:hypothetical protein